MKLIRTEAMEKLLYNVKENTHTEIAKGRNAVFSYNEKIVAFSIQAGFDTLRNMKLNEIEKDTWVKDTLRIYFTEQDSLVMLSDLIDYHITKKGNSLAYTLDKEKKKPERKRRSFFVRNKKEKTNKEGYTLFLLVSLHFKQGLS